MSSCIVVIPVYKNRLNELEQFSLDYSLAHLKPGRQITFIAPYALDMSYYVQRYPGVGVLKFPDVYFASIPGYNRLLLSPAFYEQFNAHEFMLILQTDALVLKDDLDAWCSLPYDYVGAPWPNGLEVTLNLDAFSGERTKRVRALVGNGGFSLRRNASCIRLLAEFPQATDMFMKTGSSEDIFFAILGSQSLKFMIPNERVAALFSLELQPEVYYAQNDQVAPMGAHAWWRYNQAFWERLLDMPVPVSQEVGATPELIQ